MLLSFDLSFFFRKKLPSRRVIVKTAKALANAGAGLDKK